MQLDPYVYRAAELQSSLGVFVQQVPSRVYAKAVESFPTFSITHSNKCVGGAILIEDRFHIAVLPEFRGLVGRQIIKAFYWGLSKQDPFFATVAKENKDAIRLIKFFNNTLVGQDAETLTYSITSKET